MHNEHRNNAFLWIGALVPWVAGITYALALPRLFPGESNLSSVSATAALFGLFAGGPALLMSYESWLGYASRLFFGLINLLAGVILLLCAEPSVAPGSRWPHIIAGELIIASTVWSFAFGWVANRRGDRRLAEVRGEVAG